MWSTDRSARILTDRNRVHDMWSRSGLVGRFYVLEYKVGYTAAFLEISHPTLKVSSVTRRSAFLDHL
jgi:hypothetical protein